MQCLLLAQSGHFNFALPRTSELSFDKRQITKIVARLVQSLFTCFKATRG